MSEGPPTIRELLPSPHDAVDVVARYGADDRRRPDGRPWVVVNMVTSLDGATAIDGRSGGLGGPADRQVFAAIRAVADVILVAGGTARAEAYGQPAASAEVRAARQARGQQPVPRVAIVTASLRFDPRSRLFTEPGPAPLFVTTTDAGADAVAAAADHGEVVTAGTGTVEVGAALDALAARGLRVVLAEGGPSLNGQLVAGDLVDELCVSVAPSLVGGDSPRLAVGASPARRGMRLDRLLEADGMLFGRYLRDR